MAIPAMPTSSPLIHFAQAEFHAHSILRAIRQNTTVKSLRHKSARPLISGGAKLFCLVPKHSALTSLLRYSSDKATKMADDASYNAFLARANQDPRSGHEAEGHSTSQARSKFDPTSSWVTSEAIPAPLRQIEATYVSDTDADFAPVFFNYASDQLPSLDEFTKALGVKGQNGQVEELTVKQFDPRGQYQDVITKVEQAGRSGGVRAFRVGLGGTRVEYYVLTVGERSLVGVVAKAVES